jgi:hypothetical protein
LRHFSCNRIDWLPKIRLLVPSQHPTSVSSIHTCLWREYSSILYIRLGRSDISLGLRAVASVSPPGNDKTTTPTTNTLPLTQSQHDIPRLLVGRSQRVQRTREAQTTHHRTLHKRRLKHGCGQRMQAHNDAREGYSNTNKSPHRQHVLRHFLL